MTPLTPAAIAKLREMLGKAQLPWTSKLFGVTRGASWGHIAISAVNALPALLDAAEENERLQAKVELLSRSPRAARKDLEVAMGKGIDIAREVFNAPEHAQLLDEKEKP